MTDAYHDFERGDLLVSCRETFIDIYYASNMIHFVRVPSGHCLLVTGWYVEDRRVMPALFGTSHMDASRIILRNPEHWIVYPCKGAE